MTQPTDLKQFWKRLDPLRQAVDEHLDLWLPKPTDPPARLNESMRYSVFAGGKRVRPVVMLLTSRAAGGADADVMPAACAIECIHAYSLIHDDLPAMDDDDFRRGRPSNHKAFDEATAILAGDALLTVAFELVAAHTPQPDVAARLTLELATAAGWAGMVGGQMADLLAEGAQPDEALVRSIHRRKTGALLRASVRCGAIAAHADAPMLDALTRYAENIGLAFQIADDILDATATSEQLGKTAGKDAKAGKLTFPAVLGLDRSREEALRAAADAKAAIAALPDSFAPLATLADFIVARAS